MKAQRRFARSRVGNGLILLVLIPLALFMVFPLVYSINNSLKPMDELFKFPPNLFVRNPTLDNFGDISVLIRDSIIPLSVYVFNSLYLTIAGVLGQIVIASLAAYMISKHNFFGRTVLMEMVILSLMFQGAVVSIPSYVIMTKLHLINTHWAILLPSFCSSMGLFLMKQFIDSTVPDTLLEAARIDGAGEMRIFSSIVMPLCKPAWLTMIIFSFQGLWGTTGGSLIFDERLKTLPTAFANISAGGLVTRTGVSAAISVIMFVPPIVTFLITQSNVLETMSTSGIKD